MRILVTGASGLLGSAILEEVRRRRHEFIGTSRRRIDSRQRLDITNRAAVFALAEAMRPDAIIHCAGWTAVDAAEEPQNREAVWRTNVDGTRFAAAAAKRISSKFLFVSTDYVFDGCGALPFTPDALPHPVNWYGRSKLAAERAAAEELEELFIVRTSWLFDASKGFFNTMLGLARNSRPVRVVSDQIGRPTFAPHLARLLVDMAETDRYGTYHATNSGPYASRAELVEKLFSLAGVSSPVIPVTTEEFGEPLAKRPRNSRLATDKLLQCGFPKLPSWTQAFREFLAARNQG